MMTKNGVTTTKSPGQEKYETFRMNGGKMFQYDYRHTDGELFSCVKTTLKKCREARNLWLQKKEPTVPESTTTFAETHSVNESPVNGACFQPGTCCPSCGTRLVSVSPDQCVLCGWEA